MDLHTLIENRWMNFSVMAFLIGASLIPVIPFPSLGATTATPAAINRMAPATDMLWQTEPALNAPIPASELVNIEWTLA